MSSFQPPAPDLAKLLEAWKMWKAGDELPGRTLADMKTASLDQFLEVLSADSDQAAQQFASLTLWEKGKAMPEVTLEALDEAGLGDLIEAAAAAL